MDRTEVKFALCGDSAVTMIFGHSIAAEINDCVLKMDRCLKVNPIPAVIETVPTYCSLLILYDKKKTSCSALCSQLLERLEYDTDGAHEGQKYIRTWKIPCCYGSHFGLDLDHVCETTGLSRAEVIQRHSRVVYRIYMLGFLPGFVYLGGMDPILTVPRLRVPRAEIPKGSVGIGGSQTGVYPLASPGGWQLIGATPVDLYDPNREEPVFFRAGDRLQFVPINSCEYYDIRQDILRKRYIPELVLEQENPKDRKEAKTEAVNIRKVLRTDSLLHTREFIEVLQKGLLTTVQDAGRFGYQAMGVPVSGAMDRLSFTAANELVGNESGDAALEMTLMGGSYQFLDDGKIALTGADMKPRLNGEPVPMGAAIEVKAGDQLNLGAALTGSRTYMAVAGGIRVPEVMGSRSTFSRCGIGGVQGRPLQAGDRLSVGENPAAVLETEHISAYQWFAKTLGAKNITVHVIPGPQDDCFTEAGKQTFYTQEYTLTPKCDRMGLRLDGPVIESIQGTDIISDGTVFGSIQITGAGKPIILMADRQTTGGYAKIATVISEDLPMLAQAVPGTKVRFISAVT